jgi:hypothetical protein
VLEPIFSWTVLPAKKIMQLHFTSWGSRTSTIGMYANIILYLGWILVFIMSFIIPEKVGPWWVWTLVLVLLVGFSIWIHKLDGVEVEVTNLRNSKFSLDIHGPRTKEIFPVVEEYAFWYCMEQMPLKYGGGSFVKRFVKFRGTDGKEIIFKEMGDRKRTFPNTGPIKSMTRARGGAFCMYISLKK